MNEVIDTERYANITWKDFDRYGGISPIRGLNMVTVSQVHKLLGVKSSDLQLARQRGAVVCELLGMLTCPGDDVAPRVPGAVREPNGTWVFPLENGDSVKVGRRRTTFYPAGALMHLIGEYEDYAPELQVHRKYAELFPADDGGDVWPARKIVSHLMKEYRNAKCGGNTAQAWSNFYTGLKRKYGYDIKKRRGAGPLLDRIHKNEWLNVLRFTVSLAMDAGIDISTLGEATAQAVQEFMAVAEPAAQEG